MELPGEVTEQLSSFWGTLEALEDYLNPFTDVTPKEMDAQLPPLERARAHLALAQATCLLFQMHLKLHGQRPEDHPVKQEMERLERYEKKVRKALAIEELAATRPTITLDIAAANRFIDHAIPDLSKEQKERLKQAGAVMKKRAVPAPLPEAQQHSNKKQKKVQLSVEEETAMLLEQAFASEEGVAGAAAEAETAAQQPKKKKRKSTNVAEAGEMDAPLVNEAGGAEDGPTVSQSEGREAGMSSRQQQQSGSGSAAARSKDRQLADGSGAQLHTDKKKKRKSKGQQGT